MTVCVIEKVEASHHVVFECIANDERGEEIVSETVEVIDPTKRSRALARKFLISRCARRTAATSA